MGNAKHQTRRPPSQNAQRPAPHHTSRVSVKAKQPLTNRNNHDLEKGLPADTPHDEILDYDQEDLTKSDLRLCQLQAQDFLREGKLTELVKVMWHVLDNRYAKGKRDGHKDRKSQSLQLADIPIVLTKIPRRGALPQKEALPQLEHSDRFWLVAMIIYARFLEGWGTIPGTRRKAGLTAIPLVGNAFQTFCAPIIMVGIPKWIRCPPSVMYGIWWTWFKATLAGYIPLLGTVYQVRKAPVTHATQRLIVYLKLRQFMMASAPYRVTKKGKVKAYRTTNLRSLIGNEVIYPAGMHHDIVGDWRGCCSGLW